MKRASAVPAFVVAAVFLLLVAGLVVAGRLPLPLLWLQAGLSVVAFVVYAMDKSAARRRGRRTPENTLHVLALLGGWPGALYAQQLLRHKSAKVSFRVVFAMTVVANVSALGYLASGHGAWLVGIINRVSGTGVS